MGFISPLNIQGWEMHHVPSEAVTKGGTGILQTPSPCHTQPAGSSCSPSPLAENEQCSHISFQRWVPHAASQSIHPPWCYTHLMVFNSLFRRELGPRPPVNILGDANLWFSNTYTTKHSFLFFFYFFFSFCIQLCCTLECSFSRNNFSFVFPYGSIRNRERI